MNLLGISVAWAAEEAAKPNPILNLVPFGVVLLVFYFLMIKPQQKKHKEMMDMKKSIKIGQKVLTSSGISGSVVEIGDDDIQIKTKTGVTLDFRKDAIIEIIKDEADPKKTNKN